MTATVAQITTNNHSTTKSSGPATVAGKAKASQNSLKHGIRSPRLFLADEDPTEFQQLLDGLVESLDPVGTMEQLLVQRIALGWWRQQRLIRAETAGIELSRRMELHDNRWRVKSALGLGIEQEIAPGHLEPLTEDDEAIADDCRKIVNEYVRLDPEVIENNDLKTLTVAAPFLFQSLEFHAEGQTVPEFLALRKGGLAAWVQKEVEGRRFELYTHLAHKRVAAVVELVKSSRSMPVDMDLISRYQTSLDNDLYKAARALREAQEHRLKVIQGTASEIEGAAGSFGNIGG